MSVKVGEKVLLPEYGGTKIVLEDKVGSPTLWVQIRMVPETPVVNTVVTAMVLALFRKGSSWIQPPSGSCATAASAPAEKGATTGTSHPTFAGWAKCSMCQAHIRGNPKKLRNFWGHPCFWQGQPAEWFSNSSCASLSEELLDSFPESILGTKRIFSRLALHVDFLVSLLLLLYLMIAITLTSEQDSICKTRKEFTWQKLTFLFFAGLLLV